VSYYVAMSSTSLDECSAEHMMTFVAGYEVRRSHAAPNIESLWLLTAAAHDALAQSQSAADDCAVQC
jgi:hypothetical protein